MMPLHDIYNMQNTPTGGTGGGVSVCLESAETLIAAGKKVMDARSHADNARKKIEAATGSADAFGSYPAGQSFASQHDAVAKVMASTMDAISADIDAFGHTIVTSAKNYRDTDDLVAGVIGALTKSVGGPSAVNEAFDASITDSGGALVNVEMNADEAQASGALNGTTEVLEGTNDSPDDGNGGIGQAADSAQSFDQ